MVERICSTCGAGVALDADVCEVCAMALHQPLAAQPRAALARRGTTLPVRWQRAGKAVALGAVALAVEAGAAWLKQREQRGTTGPAPLARRTSSGPLPPVRGGFVARQRVWETYDGERLSRRVVEQTIWHLPDEYKND